MSVRNAKQFQIKRFSSVRPKNISKIKACRFTLPFTGKVFYIVGKNSFYPSHDFKSSWKGEALDIKAAAARILFIQRFAILLVTFYSTVFDDDAQKIYNGILINLYLADGICYEDL